MPPYLASFVCTLVLIMISQLEAFRYFLNVWSIFFGNCQACWDGLADKSSCRAVSWTHVKEEVEKLAPQLTSDLHTTSTPKKANNWDTYQTWLPFVKCNLREAVKEISEILISSFKLDICSSRIRTGSQYITHVMCVVCVHSVVRQNWGSWVS